jgi:hypothetical protein
MLGDPAESREHAKECLRIAANATRLGARELVEELARSWLPGDLENSAALHKEWGEPSVKKSIVSIVPEISGEIDLQKFNQMTSH